MDAEAENTSLLYSFIPQPIQRKTGQILSLRRTLYSQYERASSRSRGSSASSGSGRVTPPPAYVTISGISEDGSDVPALLPLSPSKTMSRPASAGSDSVSDADGSASSRSLDSYDHETNGGIKWKYAGEGHTCLLRSSSELQSRAPDPLFARSLYIDSISYLMRGLPTDLSQEEIVRLRAACPAEMDSSVLGQTPTATSSPGDDEVDLKASRSVRPSLLQLIVANLTFWMIVLMRFIMPFVQRFAQQAYRYDRAHRISDRALAAGMTTAQAFGLHVLALASSICAVDDGKMIRLLREFGAWFAHAFVGGLCDGVGQGLEAIEYHPAATEAR